MLNMSQIKNIILKSQIVHNENFASSHPSVRRAGSGLIPFHRTISNCLSRTIGVKSFLDLGY